MITVKLCNSGLMLCCREEAGVTLPAPGRYATGIFFLDPGHREESEKLFDDFTASHGLKVGKTSFPIFPFHVPLDSLRSLSFNYSVSPYP